MATEFQIILCTCPQQELATNIAEKLVTENLAACVNIIPRIMSIYRWQGVIEKAPEFLLLIKTSTKHFAAIEDLIKHKHPYEVPEILSLPIVQGSATYLNWLDQNLHEESL